MGEDDEVNKILESKGVEFLKAEDVFDPKEFEERFYEEEKKDPRRKRAEEMYQSMETGLLSLKKKRHDFDVFVIHFPSEDVFIGASLTGTEDKVRAKYPNTTKDQIFYRAIGGKIRPFRKHSHEYPEDILGECYLFDGPLPIEDIIQKQRKEKRSREI